MRTFDLKNRVVLITGAALGIGRAMVRAFTEEGAQVFGCDIAEEDGRALQKELGSSFDFYPVDLRDADAISGWFEKIRAKTDRLDVLINNAGVDSRIPLEELDTEIWDQFFALNIRAGFLCAKQAVPLMTQGGSIINLGSVTFQLGYAPMAAYVSTKGAVVGLTRSLARELGPKGIRVNTLSPGWTMTERQLQDNVDEKTEAFLREAQCDPRPIQTEEVANVALFLASPLSAAVTGQNLYADRGWIHH